MLDPQPGPERLSASEIASATNAVRRAIDSFKSGGQVTIHLISSAFAAVRHISELRRSSGSEGGNAETAHDLSEMEAVVSEYHAVLLQWNQLLPRVNGWLLTERARLETRVGHAASVQTWLEANRQTR